MINLKDISISYGKDKVIEGLDLTVDLGTIHGLVGLNGSGKTTLINAICGLKEIESGEMAFNNLPLQKREIAYLETANYFYSKIRGDEYLELFRLKNKSFDVNGWNQLFELPLSNLIESYSTGMKKKIAFMGIIALDRPILILDEPFNGVDLETIQKLKMIIKALRDSGKTVLITSHILESLTSICDRISYLEGKKIKYTFSSEEFVGMEEKIFRDFNAKNELLIKQLVK